MTPASAFPVSASSKATRVPKVGKPRVYPSVPSMGSTVHRRAAPPVWSPISSPSTGYAWGWALESHARILRSPSLSAEVTTEPSALRSIARLGLRKAARISADACCAARTARSRISRTGGIDADMEARYQLGAAVSSAAPGLSALLGLGELHGELIRLPPDRRVADRHVARIIRSVQEVALLDELEARGRHFLLHSGRIDPVHARGHRGAGACRGRVIDDDVGATRLQQAEHRLVEGSDVRIGSIVEVVVVIRRP